VKRAEIETARGVAHKILKRVGFIEVEAFDVGWSRDLGSLTPGERDEKDGQHAITVSHETSIADPFTGGNV
jgi:hypothetical protein